MFGGLKFRTNCSEMIYMLLQHEDIPAQQCVEFTEDHKKIINVMRKLGLNPRAAVLMLAKDVLISLTNNTHQDIRTYNNCSCTRDIAILVAGKLTLHLQDDEAREMVGAQDIEDAIKELTKDDDRLLKILKNEKEMVEMLSADETYKSLMD